jgi:hypothetical protein
MREGKERNRKNSPWQQAASHFSDAMVLGFEKKVFVFCHQPAKVRFFFRAISAGQESPNDDTGACLRPNLF